MLTAPTLKVSVIFKLLFSFISAACVVWWLFSSIWSWGCRIGLAGELWKAFQNLEWTSPLLSSAAPTFCLQTLVVLRFWSIVSSCAVNMVPQGTPGHPQAGKPTLLF